MDPAQFTALFEQQRKYPEAAKARKGQKATNKASRAELEFNFFKLAQNAAGKKEGQCLRTTQINYAYSPSIVALASLKPITISKLRLETRHAGRVLIVRTYAQPVRLQSVMNAVEDQNLDVDQVTVYNKDPSASPADVLPKGEIFAIKEPYYKIGASGGYAIRIDHPSDIFQLSSTHALMPLTLAPRLVEIDENASRLKNKGNAAYKKQQHATAVNVYTRGLAACSGEEKMLRHDLRRNRSFAYFYLGRYEAAAKDAVKALYPEAGATDKQIKENVKALYRAGRAFYHLQDFSKAELHLEHLLELAPDDKDAQDQLQKTKARLAEAHTGNYGFAAMRNSAGEKGRGLFATKDLKAGELVLVEKAFEVVFESETGNATHMIMNLNTNTIRTGPRIVQKLSDNVNQAEQFLQLHDGGYTPKCTARIVDGVAAIDTFQVAAIVEKNCFGCAKMSTADEVGAKISLHKTSSSVGLWVVASRMNHACAANSHRSFIGDIMIVRATKNIKKDDEIYISYRPPSMDHVEIQRVLKNWNFTCTCRVCAAEAQTSESDRKERQTLVKKVAAFLEHYKVPSQYTYDPMAFARAKNILNPLEKTYDANIFAHVPRLPIIRLISWMSAAFDHNTIAFENSLQAAQRVLQECCYIIEVKDQALEIDSTYCFLDGTDVNAGLCAARACFRLGKVELGQQYAAFARERYLILHGATKIPLSATDFNVMP